MSQLAVSSTVLPPCWNAEPGTGEPELAMAAIEGPIGAVLPAAALAANLDLSCAAATAYLPLEVARDFRRQAPCPCPIWKRLIDIVGSGVLMMLLSPFFLAIAMYIKCVSHGPVLFRQRRFGIGGRPFKVWKFRTIEVSDASAQHRSHVTDLMASDRPLEKRDHKLDVIPGGGLLRRMGIDELPQLLNVFKGEMSLVGPRPDVVPIRDYSSWQRRRFEVLPGITGLWQVSGKNQTTFSTMMRLDALYVRRRSIWLDIWIMLRTFPALLFD